MAADPSLGRSPPAIMAWSIGFVVVGLFVTAALVQAAASLVPGLARSSTESIVASTLLSSLVGVAVFLPMSLLVGRRVLGLSRQAIGWWGVPDGSRGFGRGLAVGLAVGMVALAIAVPFGLARWMADGGSFGAYVGRMGLLGLILLPAALAEELTFRGVALAGISRATSPGVGILITSVLFLSAHALNPGVTPLALGNIGLAGMFLGLTFFARGGLWTATGAHWGWNLALAGLGAPVSGLPFEVPWLDYLAGGPAWLTGGTFGPEGGLLATLALALGIVIVARWRPQVEAT